jgi:uncharacterized membrane protein
LTRLISFSITLVLFVVFDFIWLGLIVKNFNMRQLAEVGRIEDGVFKLNYMAALVTYFLMALAVQFYVLPQVEGQESLLKVFCMGALLGLIIYGVFDMTNLAILKNYPVAFVAPDIAWGGFVFGLVTVIMSRLPKI